MYLVNILLVGFMTIYESFTLDGMAFLLLSL
jgi:hypothetical protein